MPTYQYACTECGNAFEAVQSFSDDALTDCPACNGRLRKVFSSVGIVFKGSGFYRNDSREAAKSATSPPDKNGADKGGASPDKKEKAGSTAGDSGTKTSDSPSKSPPASTASTPSTSASSGSTSSSTGSAA